MAAFHPEGYLLGDSLGEGSCGEVYSAVRAADGAVFAAKLVAGVKDEDAFEATILKRLHHPSIVRYIDSKFDSQNKVLFIITELCNGGTLDDKLRKTPGNRLSTVDAVVLAKTILEAMRYLHVESFVHCDIKVGTRTTSCTPSVKLTCSST